MQQKKKPNTQQNQKHLAAQYRANFFRTMKLIIDNVCGTHIYPVIPPHILVDAYLCRSAPFKFQADYRSNISTLLLNNAKVIMTHIIKVETILLPPNNLEITLHDYCTVVITIIILEARLNEDAFNEAPMVKKALEVFKNDEATNLNANDQLYSILNSFNLGESDLGDKLYWYRHDMVMPKTAPAQTENVITMFSETPESINVEVDGTIRPALRVGWAFAYAGADWVSLKPAQLGIKSPFAEIPLKVYIQRHALHRLSERIDCFWTGNLHFCMFDSLQYPKIAYDNNHNLLVEYRFFGTKAGYFRADIVNGIILLRTFLFVTNNGTPEGQLLEKNTGLQKLDKKYLTIDKLSTFMNSDLDKNEEVQKIFKSSDCKCLIDLFNTMKPLMTKKENGFNFDMMLSYINPLTINKSPFEGLNF
jgi:hypothetical protein